jgi:hypothetical protein
MAELLVGPLSDILEPAAVEVALEAPRGRRDDA